MLIKHKREAPIEGAPALIIRHLSLFGGRPRKQKVRKFSVSPPGPYAQHHTAVGVWFVLPRRRKSEYLNVVPDNLDWLTIEQDGKVIYDSRDEVPCDMVRWHASAAEWAGHDWGLDL